LGVSRYGIDTEFLRERTYYARLALLQVAWEDGIALIDPTTVDVARFAPVLSGKGLTILHAADQDLEVLERTCGVVPDAIFDTQLAAGFIGLSTPSLQSIVERLLGLRLEKGDRLTDWSHRPLTPDQLRYAAGDVAHLLELHEILRERLCELNRLDWANDEFALLRARSRSVAPIEQAWWRLKHARQLRGRERQVAQAIAAWREQRAMTLDVPTRFVLSDLALESIAHRPPTSSTELCNVRGLDARVLSDGVGAALFDAISEGLSMDGSKLCLPAHAPTDVAAKPAVSLVAAWVNERAHELQIDPSILATRADLALYLKDPPEGRLANSWRHGLIGEPIRRLVGGDASLALEGGTRLVLEERSGRPLVQEP
jgi:ribonuclease D